MYFSFQIRKCAGTVQATRAYNFDVLIGSAGYLLGALLAGKIQCVIHNGMLIYECTLILQLSMISIFIGCSGGINGLAGIMGREMCQVYTLFKEGKIAEANKIQNKIANPDILVRK